MMYSHTLIRWKDNTNPIILSPEIHYRWSLRKVIDFVFNQIQAHGLSTQYEKDNGTYEFLHKILALPFLPAEAIQPTWQQLKGNATTPALRNVVNYVTDTWIEGNTWPPSAWSVYGRSIQTNNDLEGWHSVLNRRASGKSQLPMYLLLKLLHKHRW